MRDTDTVTVFVVTVRVVDVVRVITLLENIVDSLIDNEGDCVAEADSVNDDANILVDSVCDVVLGSVSVWDAVMLSSIVGDTVIERL